VCGVRLRGSEGKVRCSVLLDKAYQNSCGRSLSVSVSFSGEIEKQNYVSARCINTTELDGGNTASIHCSENWKVSPGLEYHVIITLGSS